jgi:hypothetical protein
MSPRPKITAVRREELVRAALEVSGEHERVLDAELYAYRVRVTEVAR